MIYRPAESTPPGKRGEVLGMAKTKTYLYGLYGF